MADGTKKVVPLARRRRKTKTKCAMCGRPVEAEFKPFCSKRCADADLAKWLGGDYKVPTNEQPDDVNGDDKDDA
jgi:hypothetical protein